MVSVFIYILALPRRSHTHNACTREKACNHAMTFIVIHVGVRLPLLRWALMTNAATRQLGIVDPNEAGA